MDEEEFVDRHAAPLESLRASRRQCPHPDLLLAAREGVLPEETGASILAHLAECPLCQALERDLADPELTAPTSQEGQRIRRRVQQDASGRPRRRWLWFAVPAAAAAVLSIVFLAPREPRREPVAATPRASAPLEKPPVKIPLASALVWRGEGGDAQKLIDELNQALEPYRADRYEEASRRLQAFAAKHPNSAEAHFYLGVCLLFLDRKPEAAASLEKAKEIAKEPLAAEVARYLDLARR